MLKKLQQNPLASLLLVVLFDQTSMSIIYPVLTLIFFDPTSTLLPTDASLASRNLWYGIASSITYITSLIATPLLSLYSDYVGRKKTLLICALSALVLASSHALALFLSSLSLLLMGRLFSGLCARTEPVAQAVIGDISQPHNKLKIMGYLQLVISIGAFIGPILGGTLAKSFYFNLFNFTLPFVVATGFATIGAWLTWKVFQETWQPSHRLTRIAYREWFALLKDKRILMVSINLLLIQLSWSTYYQFMPPLLSTQLHFSASQIGLFVGLIALWLAFACAFGIRLLQNWLNSWQMIRVCILSMFIGLAAVPLILSLPWAKTLIWLTAVPVAMGDVIAYSALITLYSNLVEQHVQGKIMGLCFLIVSMAWASTGLLGGILNKWHPVCAIVLAPLAVLALLLLKIETA